MYGMNMWWDVSYEFVIMIMDKTLIFFIFQGYYLHSFLEKLVLKHLLGYSSTPHHRASASLHT